MTTITGLLDDHRIIVCTGTGGVGKTTTAAAVALEGAERGLRAVVITIDPAKRLADALGLDGLTNQPSRVSFDAPGELWALMLDTKTTFDELVVEYAGDDDQAQRILQNRFYQNISAALSGTQEYMAMEKLYELAGDDRFDLLVVDTPPTRNALDFIDAPNVITRMFDNWLYKAVMAPSRGALRAVNKAAQTLMRQLSRIVGAEVVDDAIAFFQAFEGMEDGFKSRANSVLALLASEESAFVLVASPRHDTIDEARYFADQLSEANIAVRGIVINRMHPYADSIDAAEAKTRAMKASGRAASWWKALADFQATAEREREHIDTLLEAMPANVATARVPMLASDVHDIGGLHEIRSLLG